MLLVVAANECYHVTVLRPGEIMEVSCHHGFKVYTDEGDTVVEVPPPACPGRIGENLKGTVV